MARATDQSIPPEAAEKLVKVAGLLASDAEGERATAALMGTKLLAKYGLAWADVITARALPAPDATPGAAARPERRYRPHRHDSGRRPLSLSDAVSFLNHHRAVLDDWQTNFAADMARLPVHRITGPQAAKIWELVDRVRQRNGYAA